MSDDLRIPIVEEEAWISKRVVDTERVTVRTTTDEEQVTVRDELVSQQVTLTRVPIGREVAEAPPTRIEGEVTIVPVLEERLVIEKRLFLLEELHLQRTTTVDPVEIPTTLRRTRVDIDRTRLDQEEH